MSKRESETNVHTPAVENYGLGGGGEVSNTVYPEAINDYSDQPSAGGGVDLARSTTETELASEQFKKESPGASAAPFSRGAP
jgi:hypothetical protein